MSATLSDSKSLPDTVKPEVERASSSKRGRFFAGAFALALVALIVGTLLLGRTAWFLRHCDYPALGGIGYSQWAGPENCEVLIYGDSSAAASLDPAIIQKATGMKTCNISEWSTVQQVVGSDPPIRRYLAHNTPPRILLTTWAPYYFRPDEPSLNDYHIEGIWYAWRYGTWWKLRSRRFAQWTAAYIPWVMSSVLQGVEQHVMSHQTAYDPRRVRDLNHGQWPFPKPPEEHCMNAQIPFTARRWEQSVLAFRQKYASAATQVIVNVSPIPDCDTHYDAYRHLLRGQYDNTLEQLPIHDFNDSDIHLGPVGSKLVSEQAAAQIFHLLATKH